MVVLTASGTKLNAAINYLLKEKKVSVGGTSAGCAILSGIYYSGENGVAAGGKWYWWWLIKENYLRKR